MCLLNSLNIIQQTYRVRHQLIKMCALLTVIILFTLPNACAESSTDVQQRLQKILDNISSLERILSEDSANYANLEAESRELDKEIGQLHRQLQATTKRLQSTQKQLKTLHIETQSIQQRLHQQRTKLQQQLVSAYQFNAHSRWQFILNQESLQDVGRQSVIYKYLHAAQLKQIEVIHEVHQQLLSNREQITQQHKKQAALHQQQETEYEWLTKARQHKRKAKYALTGLIQDNTQALQAEQENKRALTQLLEQLVHQEDSGLQAFEDYQGQLAWPVQGTLKIHFGQQKTTSSGLQWTGVSVAAQSGTKIRSIFSGKVVFADWFDRYGWLTIIDHGNNYMSLYAHAEGLYKKNGEDVTQGEVIAIVGDSGETQEPNLYFEIRDNGSPVDPALWCHRS